MNIGKNEESIVKNLDRYMSKLGIDDDDVKAFTIAFVVSGIQNIAESHSFYKEIFKYEREQRKRIEQAEGK